MRHKNYHLFKRILDVVVSSVLLVLLSPLFLVVSILIWFQDKGPVIYTQERLGKDSKPFMIYKFRSMKISAPVVAAKDLDSDAYITPVGRFIRRTSMDELPQLVNILRGEMSFVGPRPLISNEGTIIEKRKKLGIDKSIPGLTGWAQIMDRQIENQEMKIELELYYLENQSLWFDIKVMGLTLFSLQGE